MTLIEKFKEYRRLKNEIVEEFGIDCWDDIEDHTDDSFSIANGDVRWEKIGEDEWNYSECLRENPVRKDGLVLCKVHLCTGDDCAMLFDESKESK